jgi:hypothetical protein
MHHLKVGQNTCQSNVSKDVMHDMFNLEYSFVIFGTRQFASKEYFKGDGQQTQILVAWIGSLVGLSA